MKVKMLEKVLHGRDIFEKDDIRSIPDELGAYFCNCGWAEDIDGNMATSARDTKKVILAPNNAVHSTKVGEANG